MKGFLISVKNELLDPKHVENMGASVWLYMYLLDKMTAVNDNGIGKVNGGHPLIFELVEAELGVSHPTYKRWVKQLRDCGYINTLRTPYGLVFTINKAVKVFGKRSIKNDTSDRVKPTKPKKEIAQKRTADGSKMILKMDQNRTSNNNNTINNTNTVTNTSISNEPSAPQEFGDPEINKVIEHFEKRIGKMPRQKAQRRATAILIKRHGFEQVIGAINAVVACRDEQFAPIISNIEDLKDKWVNLETFYRRIGHTRSNVTRIE